MPPDDSNEFFDHLNQPATPRRIRRPSSGDQQRPHPDDFSTVPDPFGEDGDAPAHPPLSFSSNPSGVLQGRGRERSRAPKGPGLSPGVPKQVDQRPPTQQIPRSGVVLTPSGVKRVDDDPPAPPPKRVVSQRVDVPPDIPEDDADDFHAQSRQANDEDDVSWEEYAAGDFPAMSAEEFGVKTKKTDSGRVVPVAVRSDLTDEAIKGRSIKDKGGRGRPVKTKAKAAPAAPKSFFGKIGDSLRLSKPVLDDDEDEVQPSKDSGGGFARSGSLPTKRTQRHKKTPLGIVWSVGVEVLKILMLVLLLRAYVVQVSQVQGPSMEGTLYGGDVGEGIPADRLIVERVTPGIVNNEDKWWISWLPDAVTPGLTRGDIIVVRSPEDPGSELVKRLIGLPGDTLKFEDGNLYLKKSGTEDFEQVKEDYLTAEDLKREDGTFRAYAPGDLGDYIEEGEPLLVPEGRIFVMGDNRTHSNDSRRWLGIHVNRTETPGIDRLWLHQSSLEGRVIFRIWPFGRIWPPVK
ncbi:MAG: signal peptidase I [Planctomycetes bacterium]|nr:signal peptidase I [Planctomycetota bacterium]